MTWRRQMTAFVQRESAELEDTAPITDEASTPYQKLLRAAQSGRFETLVAKSRPAQPVAMVTPQEREAELRAQGRWSTESPASKQAPEPAPPPEPEEPPPGPDPRFPPAQYIQSHWRPRSAHDEYSQPRGGLLHDYDPLADWDKD